MIAPGNKIQVNIRHPVHKDVETKSKSEKNLIRLDVIHTALLRVENQYRKLDLQKLNSIKETIINNNFSFDFVLKAYKYKKDDNLVAKIVVHPEMDKFNHFLLAEEDQKLKCKEKLYCEIQNLFYYADLFSTVKWKSINELSITGKAEEVEICVTVN